MSGAASLSAPPAAAMAAITASMFMQKLPYHMMLLGIIIILAFYLYSLVGKSRWHISLIGLAIGMYLPLDASTALFIGALLNYLVLRKQHIKKIINDNHGITTACGLVAGAAITNVALAIPLALMHSHQVLVHFSRYNYVVSLIATLAICLFIYFNATTLNKKT
jgi:uncharacterized oligopeptide transporter (OPT) family protein